VYFLVYCFSFVVILFLHLVIIVHCITVTVVSVTTGINCLMVCGSASIIGIGNTFQHFA